MARFIFAIVLCLLFASYIPMGCDSSGGGGSGSSTTVEQPPAELVIRAVRDLGVIPVNPMILKRDCGFSAIFQQRLAFIFGDTLLESPNAEDCCFPSNSWSFTYDLDVGDGIAGLVETVDAVGAPLELFPLTQQEKDYNASHAGECCEIEPCTAHWDIWPGTIVVDDARDVAYVFYRKVHVEDGLFKFIHIGHSVAVWKKVTEVTERPVFNYVDSYPTLMFSEEGPGFGSASLVMGDVVYVYGCELGEDKLSKPCHLARVPIADILDRSAWSFYSGAGNWSPEILDAAVVFYGNDMMSVSFNPHLNRYIAVYSQSLGAEAMIRIASRPEGPWSAPVELFSVEAPENVHGWVYDFLAHPDLSQDNGRTIYITYTIKTDPMTSEMKLVAVDLDMSR